MANRMLSGKRSVENTRYARSVSSSSQSSGNSPQITDQVSGYGVDEGLVTMHEQLKQLEALKSLLNTSAQKEILQNLEQSILQSFSA